MFEEFLMPLDRHFDSGFGATANSFHEAAKALDVDAHKTGFGLSSSKLPVFYLYRHAIELYMKSILTILHRRFGSSFPNIKQTDFPKIKVKEKSEPIFRVHSIAHLFDEFRSLLEKNSDQINSIGKTDWTKIPKGVDEQVELIDKADKASTMFRYPMTLDPLNDKKKHSFKSIPPNEAIAEAHHRTNSKLPGVMVLALKDENENIVESFIHDGQPMPEVFNALKMLVDTLSGAQLGMRHEFIDA
ncbi:hypothetical protein P4C99_21630 [Pontiellaceae bacterium B1224]|nr:hypothetical protein [Pontiellaceae bacterium B1224]